MAIPVLVCGYSGSGKTASLRNFKKNEVLLFRVVNKPFPFKGNLNKVDLMKMNYSERYDVIKQAINKYKDQVKTFVIDDSQYLMSLEFLERSNERGFDKFTELAKKFIDLVTFILGLDEDITVYFLHHLENDDLGMIKAKTIGKMIDEKITLEGLFTIVLNSNVKDGEFMFSTKNNGKNNVKAPMGMFETEFIDNDLRKVDKGIREYYGISNPYKKEESEEK